MIGIGVNIFGVAIATNYALLHNWTEQRFYITVISICLFASNSVFQLTPCYTEDRCKWVRVGFYFGTIFCGLCLSVFWRFVIATEFEIE